jgi:ABC-type transport system involved in multi-copper enzyme maturation permease subunit
MKLWAISYNTFREAIRDRVLYNLLAFAVLMIGLAVALGRLSIAERERITVDVGLFSISVFGILMAIFLGIGLVSKEIEKKTIYTLVAKPVPRYLFILGRFFGLMITIGVNMVIMTAAYAFVLWYNQEVPGWPLGWPIAQAIILTYVELGIITAAAMVFSTFSTPTLSAIFTLSFVVIGRLTEGLKDLIEKQKNPNPLVLRGAQALYLVIPNLHNYVRIEEAIYGDGIPLGLFLRLIAVGLLTAAFLLVIAIAIFQRRNFV